MFAEYSTIVVYRYNITSKRLKLLIINSITIPGLNRGNSRVFSILVSFFESFLYFRRYNVIHLVILYIRLYYAHVTIAIFVIFISVRISWMLKFYINSLVEEIQSVRHKIYFLFLLIINITFSYHIFNTLTKINFNKEILKVLKTFEDVWITGDNPTILKWIVTKNIWVRT